MIDWISCKDRLPEPGEYVFIIILGREEFPMVGYRCDHTISPYWILGNGEMDIKKPGEVLYWAEINLPKKLLTIHEAIDAFKEGEKIRRNAWSARDFLQKDNYFNSLSINSIYIYDIWNKQKGD